MENKETHYEIERKYLIRRPSEKVLSEYPGAVSYRIEQIYLPKNENGDSARIRRREKDDGTVECFYTVKRRINDLKRVEEEHIITAELYGTLKSSAGNKPVGISKKRYCLPYDGRVVEVDIYPFWKNTAIAEVEMESEDEQVSLPELISVIRDVTGEGRFINRDMAKELFVCGCVEEEKI